MTLQEEFDFEDFPHIIRACKQCKSELGWIDEELPFCLTHGPLKEWHVWNLRLRMIVEEGWLDEGLDIEEPGA
jgi:hypothetical protein